MARLVELAARGAGWLAARVEFPQAVGDEVDDALLGLGGPSDAAERGHLGEDGVLNWRTARKRFEVRGLSQET